MRSIIRSAINHFMNIMARIQNPNIKIGQNCTIAINVKFKGTNPIVIGNNCAIRDGAILVPLKGKIIIGNNSSIGAYNYLDGSGELYIGNNVRLGAHVCIYSANHKFEDINRPICEQGLSFKKVIIEDDVWIGAHATILSGVSIGTGVVIAAGAVVNRDVPSFSIFGGVPAKLIKKRTN